MGKRNSCHPLAVELLGHFRVFPSLCFKARLSAKQVIWKSFFKSDENELHYHKKVLLLASFWKLRFLELGSGRLSNELMMNCIVGFLSNRTILFIWSKGVNNCSKPILITIHDNVLLQFKTARLITIYDSLVITILDNCYILITIYDRTHVIFKIESNRGL